MDRVGSLLTEMGYDLAFKRDLRVRGAKTQQALGHGSCGGSGLGAVPWAPDAALRADAPAKLGPAARIGAPEARSEP